MNIKKLLPFGFVVFGLLTGIFLNGQEINPDTTNQRENAVNVFIDCYYCDMNYIREEIPYINYVRDVREAQVYILETRENTGSGGEKYTYAFVGQMDFEGINDTLEYSSRKTTEELC